jgi:hypothetical protein
MISTHEDKGAVSMQRMIRISLAVLCLALLSLSARAGMEELIEAGRVIAGEKGDSIVSVRLVINIKMSAPGMGEQEEERQHEIVGTVVSADGLTVVPLSEIDPTVMYRRMLGAQASQLQIDSRIKDITIVVGGSREFKAVEVIRDADLDIAVLKPAQPLDGELVYIDLAKRAEAKLLERGVVLTRLGRVADRAVGVMTGEIQAIIEKPRTFYVPSAELASGGLGVPVFNEKQEAIGFVIVRVVAASQNVSTGMGQGNDLIVLLPTADVADIVDQAKE